MLPSQLVHGGAGGETLPRLPGKPGGALMPEWADSHRQRDMIAEHGGPQETPGKDILHVETTVQAGVTERGRKSRSNQLEKRARGGFEKPPERSHECLLHRKEGKEEKVPKAVFSGFKKTQTWNAKEMPCFVYL